MRALLSVSDKEGIVEFAKGLVELGFDLLSTGGTLKELQNNGIEALEVSSYTGHKEIFDGRVKTLHPKIHGGILQRDCDREVAEELGIDKIDLVCVNLYPFWETTQKTQDFDTIIENIDIGGPALIRAAAKNFNHVLVVTSKDDYKQVLEALRERQVNLPFRQTLMIKAFMHTAKYDSIIANYFNERFNNGFGEELFIVGHLVSRTKYGENPHQKAALYEFDNFYSKHLKTLKGEYSFNNLSDMNSAIKITQSFTDKPSICIVKHGNPCGFALREDLLECYTQAMLCDPISAYGGVIAINGTLDERLAKEINKSFFEVIVAKHITKEAQEVFVHKKKVKLFEIQNDNQQLALPNDRYDFKHISGGFLFQGCDKLEENEVENSTCVTSLKATQSQMLDLKIAYNIAALTKSNCVVYVKDQTMVAIGMGMTSRVDAARAAISKANTLGISLKGSVLASEAFFPFKDSIEEAHKVGVDAVIQPGGSIRDNEVIACANECNMAMYFTHKRHFLH